jgi:hypothetical protein
MELGSSINTALEVSTPGWWANIVTVVPRLAAGVGSRTSGDKWGEAFKKQAIKQDLA